MTNQQKVDAFIVKNEAWVEELEFIRQLLLETELEETLKWGMPTYCINKKNVLGIGAFKKHISFWFFQGVFLKDKAGKLTNAQEGKTKAMRHWKFFDFVEIKKDRKLLKTYVLEAIKNAKEGKIVKVERKAVVRMPKELKEFLGQNEKIKASFAKISAAQKREYKSFISEAKQATTKLRRLEKIKPLIMKGKGLNDQYR